MKGAKGKFLKKLKSIKPIGALKQTRILHISSLTAFLDPSSTSSFSSSTGPNTDRVEQTSPISCREQDPRADHSHVSVKEVDVIDVSQLIKDLEDGDEQVEISEDEQENKENIGPSLKAKDPSLTDKGKLNNSILLESGSSNLLETPFSQVEVPSFHPSDSIHFKDNSGVLQPKASYCLKEPLLGIDVSSFRRPDLNSSSLFDPNLLAAFEQAKMEHILAVKAVREARIEENNTQQEEEEEPPSKAPRLETSPLLDFEVRCPPGGSESVILYTTSLRGIRKTFEDCHSIRFLLNSFRILYSERDVSMHLEFREEMWRILGARVVPPRLFIMGRYIGGADEVVGLHERGKLLELLQGLPRDHSTTPCQTCAGIRFILCYNCNGSRKIRPQDSAHTLSLQCPHCNENGLIICPMCC